MALRAPRGACNNYYYYYTSKGRGKGKGREREEKGKETDSMPPNAESLLHHCLAAWILDVFVLLMVLQVQQMKSTWDAKEQKLVAERDKAFAAAAASSAKLREVDDAFRRQLDSVETSHRAAIAEFTAAKQIEVDAAKRRTAEVEDEMRVLLHETEVAKQNMESRVRKLTSAFADLQQDLTR